MSRIRRLTHSLASGYLLLGATTVQTLVSVPLALHYLTKEEFALWALALQISSYLPLIDLGMAGSISRILIDHKDHPGGGTYGAILKTGLLVMVTQGMFIAAVGTLLSFWLPGVLGVAGGHERELQVLLAGQCIVLGTLFCGRLSDFVLQAHQRYDLSNYGAMTGIAVNLVVTWATLAKGWGLYSLLAGSAAGQITTTSITLTSALRLRYFVTGGAKANVATFHELFSYGRQMFLLYVGLQLVTASQVIIVTRTLGLNAAAVWAIATKFFTLALQAVSRLLDFSAAAFSEMMARGEREKLKERFRDVVTLSASLGVWAGLSAALCNSSFVNIWTHGRIRWDGVNDWLMALQMMLAATTRCFVGFSVLTKDIRGMKYLYLLEGVIFVTLSFLAAPVLGFSGIIGSAIVSNFLCSGMWGLRRTNEYFGWSRDQSILGLLFPPFLCLVAQGAIFGAFWIFSAQWASPVRFLASGAVALLVGLIFFWRFGLSPRLRLAGEALLARWRSPANSSAAE